MQIQETNEKSLLAKEKENVPVNIYVPVCLTETEFQAFMQVCNSENIHYMK